MRPPEKALKALDYLHLQMKLEGIVLSRNGVITRLSPYCEDMPLVLLAQTHDGKSVTYFSDTLPVELQRKLIADASKFEFPKVEVLLEPIRAFGIQLKVGHFKTYIFPERYTKAEAKGAQRFPKDGPRIRDFGFQDLADTVYAIGNGKEILSACVSARQNNKSAEAWVFITPEHRRKGLAQIVVSAWATAILKEGIVPFYSHEIQNLLSAGLAKRLELIPVFEEITVERES